VGERRTAEELARAFGDLWVQATLLDEALVARYAEHAKEAHRKFVPPETVDLPAILHPPRPWQQGALESLRQIRVNNYRRALVAVATGLGKTWLAAFDVLAVGHALQRPQRAFHSRSLPRHRRQETRRRCPPVGTVFSLGPELTDTEMSTILDSLRQAVTAFSTLHST
jgi:hypothetical protein